MTAKYAIDVYQYTSETERHYVTTFYAWEDDYSEVMKSVKAQYSHYTYYITDRNLKG